MPSPVSVPLPLLSHESFAGQAVALFEEYMTKEEIFELVGLAEEAVSARGFEYAIKSRDKKISDEQKIKYKEDTEKLRLGLRRIRSALSAMFVKLEG